MRAKHQKSIQWHPKLRRLETTAVWRTVRTLQYNGCSATISLDYKTGKSKKFIHSIKTLTKETLATFASLNRLIYPLCRSQTRQQKKHQRNCSARCAPKKWGAVTFTTPATSREKIAIRIPNAIDSQTVAPEAELPFQNYFIDLAFCAKPKHNLLPTAKTYGKVAVFTEPLWSVLGDLLGLCLNSC